MLQTQQPVLRKLLVIPQKGLEFETIVISH